MKTMLIALACTMFLAMPAFADRQERRQDARIHAGLRSGELTRVEAGRLQQQQDKIDRLQHRARHDGVVSRGEAARINRVQRRASHEIAAQKNDRQRCR